jgi:PII-like signaling protein
VHWRVFIGKDARIHRRPLDEVILFKVREVHFAGATVLRVRLKVRGPASVARMFGGRARSLSKRLLIV